MPPLLARRRACHGEECGERRRTDGARDRRGAQFGQSGKDEDELHELGARAAAARDGVQRRRAGECVVRRSARAAVACDNRAPRCRDACAASVPARRHSIRAGPRTPPLSPYELAVGLRYTRARRGSGRNTFISFIALTSMAGIALGVAALIVVLSVMNGFQEELRNRILSVASHIEIRGLPTLADDAAIARTAMANPHVKAAAPYVLGQAMLSVGEANRGAHHPRHRSRARGRGRGHRHAHALGGAHRPQARRVRDRPRRGARARARRANWATRSSSSRRKAR